SRAMPVAASRSSTTRSSLTRVLSDCRLPAESLRYSSRYFHGARRGRQPSMEFRLNDGQVALRDTIAGFGAAHYGLARAAEHENRTVDRGGWRALGELGVFDLMVPERDGGVGLGAVEGAIVFEQLGLHLVPGPLIWSTLAATIVAGAASGER